MFRQGWKLFRKLFLRQFVVICIVCRNSEESSLKTLDFFWTCHRICNFHVLQNLLRNQVLAYVKSYKNGWNIWRLNIWNIVCLFICLGPSLFLNQNTAGFLDILLLGATAMISSLSLITEIKNRSGREIWRSNRLHIFSQLSICLPASRSWHSFFLDWLSSHGIWYLVETMVCGQLCPL